jgi:hypothetical protein
MSDQFNFLDHLERRLAAKASQAKLADQAAGRRRATGSQLADAITTLSIQNPEYNISHVSNDEGVVTIQTTMGRAVITVTDEAYQFAAPGKINTPCARTTMMDAVLRFLDPRWD